MIDEGTLEVVRAELASSERVDADRIEVLGAGDVIVLRGAVATDEQATVAALVAERHAQAVRNELRIDGNLREDTSAAAPPGAAPDAALQGSSTSDARPRGQELSTQVGAGRPTAISSDLTTDVDEALAENVAWDPPDEPRLAPTPTEQRGSSERDGRTVASAAAGDLDSPADEVSPSAADLSAAQLADSARPDDKDEPNHG
jgi:hypothetical protein